MFEYEADISRREMSPGPQFWSEFDMKAAKSAWHENDADKRANTAENVLPAIKIIDDKHSLKLEYQGVSYMAPWEPNRKQAASVETFMNAMNNSPSKVGQQTGENAAQSLMKMSEVDYLGYPSSVPYFNMKEGRYIYTEKGGWVDMVHFLFYAGLALKYKRNGDENPIGEAVQSGYWQERFDPTHSSYSYEDLPSDKFGADFAVNHFDANSNLTLAQQVEKYLRGQLKATDPQRAPNYESMPAQDSKNAPTRTNKTTKPVYTAENP